MTDLHALVKRLKQWLNSPYTQVSVELKKDLSELLDVAEPLSFYVEKYEEKRDKEIAKLDEKVAERKEKYGEKTCIQCGNLFVPRRENNNTCSQECSLMRSRAISKEHYARKKSA